MVIIFTKFHEDRSKNVDFLLMANFERGPFFLTQTLGLKKIFLSPLCLQRSFNNTPGYDDLIVSKFNLRKGDLIRSSQVLLLLFLMITIFIYFNIGRGWAIFFQWPI